MTKKVSDVLSVNVAVSKKPIAAGGLSKEKSAILYQFGILIMQIEKTPLTRFREG